MGSRTVLPPGPELRDGRLHLPFEDKEFRAQLRIGAGVEYPDGATVTVLFPHARSKDLPRIEAWRGGGSGQQAWMTFVLYPHPSDDIVIWCRWPPSGLGDVRFAVPGTDLRAGLERSTPMWPDLPDHNPG